ncbi:hypothetical protein HMSSN036_72830 [Paenibacillus macerans]|nr:hypothetical protein HMSSN036_72830 [Paenibacillus macerans]
MQTIGKFMSDLLARAENSTEGKYGRMTTLKIEELRSKIEGKEILKGLTLEIHGGEIHAIMGPNGTEKVRWLRL